MKNRILFALAMLVVIGLTSFGIVSLGQTHSIKSQQVQELPRTHAVSI